MFVEDNPFIANTAAVDDGDGLRDDVSGLGVIEVRVTSGGERNRDNVVGIQVGVTGVDVETTLENVLLLILIFLVRTLFIVIQENIFIMTRQRSELK